MRCTGVLWLCVYFPHFPIELREPRTAGSLAVVERHESRRRLIACNSEARARGIRAGMDATEALARAPELTLINRSLKSEAHALEALGSCCAQFTSDICLDAQRWLVWLEISGSLSYFRGLAHLKAQVRRELSALHYTAQLSVAPTLEAAALLARHGDEHTALDRMALHTALENIDTAYLALAPAVIDHLHTAGIRSVDALLKMPAPALARRFGPEVTDYLQRLVGEQPDPRPRYRSPEHYRRRYACSYPIDTLEALLFPLRRILMELQGYLRGRDSAVQALSIALRHHDAPHTTLELRMSAPQRDAAQLFAVLRETLDRTLLPQPVTEILVEADAFTTLPMMQHDLFDATRQQDATWASTLDRLRARLGEGAVRELGLLDDHRPEKAWCVRSENAPIAPDPCIERPLWILEPYPLKDIPQLIGNPERIEAGGWQGERSCRDYYFARTREGTRLWVYQDRLTRRWYLQGLWG